MEACSFDSEEITFQLEGRERSFDQIEKWMGCYTERIAKKKKKEKTVRQLQNTVCNRKTRSGSYCGDGRKLLPLRPTKSGTDHATKEREL